MDISGHAAALNSLARFIEEAEDGSTYLFGPSEHRRDWEPVGSIRIALDDRERLLVALEGNELQLIGRLTHLRLLASDIRNLRPQVPNSKFSNHMHIEYWPDHPYLDAESEPLVINIETDG
ncbi:MAG: hypothetical protein M3280_00805 [Actinomycetota bacterium]|nr:hypothetical protein [Actinomycetota bacterium]